MEQWLWSTEGRVIALALVAVAAAAIGSVWLQRRREHEWKRVARRLKLQFSQSATGPRIRGSLRGCAVEVSTCEEGSDAEGAVAVTRTRAAVGGLPAGMQAEGAPGLIGELTHLSEERLLTGDEAFDQNVHLLAEDRAAALRWWNPRRRALFLDAVQHWNYDRLLLSEGFLAVEQRTLLSDHRQLEQLLLLLAGAAPQLESGPEDRVERLT